MGPRTALGISAVFCVLASVFGFNVPAGSAENGPPVIPPAAPPPHGQAEPDDSYVAPYCNGLYTTLAGYNSLRPRKICNLMSVRLCVDNFACAVPAQVLIQPEPAPLVVLLLGAEGRSLDPIAQHWVSWLSEAGYHVLTFNSTLQADFVNVCSRGVSGNIAGEAACVRDIVAAYLKNPLIEGKVTKIGLVGISYGGLEALMVAKLAGQPDSPFKLDAVQAYSPPIDMMNSAILIDRWWREDRWKYSLPELYFLVSRHRPVDPGCDIPLDDSAMRAGLAASFRLDFVGIVDRNDAQYNLNILPEGGGLEANVRRHDYAATYGFTRFMRECTYPYWKERSHLASFDDLNKDAKLCNLLPTIPAHAQVFVADDDPLNLPTDFEALKKCTCSGRLTVLHGGGHAGFINDPWAKAKLLTIFDKR